MAYATTAQVASEAKISGDFSATTNPTSTKVGEIIAEIENMMNAQISRKYVMPATQAANQVLLRGISLALCVERVREIMETRGAVGANNDQVFIKKTADTARANLKSIVLGETPLAGETLTTTADGVRSYNTDNGITPFFKKDCNISRRGPSQW